MTLFEYLTVAVSIVLALGVVRLVEGLGTPTSTPRYWVHSSYSILLILMHLFFWWSMWFYQEGVEWNFALFVYVFLGPLLLYLQTNALVPRNSSAVTNWVDHFFGVRRQFFLVLALFIVHQMLGPLLLRGVPPKSGSAPVGVVVVALSLLGARSDSPRIHAALALGFLASLLFVAGILFFRPPNL